jgi:hypothetical protein
MQTEANEIATVTKVLYMHVNDLDGLKDCALIKNAQVSLKQTRAFNLKLNANNRDICSRTPLFFARARVFHHRSKLVPFRLRLRLVFDSTSQL